MTEKQLKDVKSKLWQVATYVSTLGSRKAEADNAKQQLAYRLKESEAIQEVMHSLAEIVNDLDKFWRKLDRALASICSIIGATYSVLLTWEKAPDLSKSRIVIRSIANLPTQFIGRIYDRYDPILLEVLQEMKPQALEFRAHSKEILFVMISNCSVQLKRDRIRMRSPWCL